MKKRLLAVCCVLFLLYGCGYAIQGFDSPAHDSVLGNGTCTLKLNKIEQSTLYTWVPYFIGSKLRDEVYLRKLAVWVDFAPADYLISVRMPIFFVDAYASDETDKTILNQATLELEILVENGKTGETVWRSGVIRYSDRYENRSEEQAVQEAITQAIHRSLDRMQIKF